MGKTIDIGGRIHNPELGNIVTGANEILDDTKNKKQDVINSEVDAALEALDANKQDNLTFDQTPTESSTNPVTSGGVYAADLALQQAIEAILTLIPSAASALNQLADKSFVNSSIATASATFRGTYNLVSDLHLSVTASHQDIATALASAVSTADNNDYCFVQIPTSDTSSDIRVTERYKFNGSAWAYEYDLNNSGFTATQWEAINSGITALLVTKLGALPTAAELATSLAGKQNVLTFDNVPVSGSDNPVKSGGLYQLFTAIDAKFPSDASSSNKLVAENRLAAYVTAVIEALDASFDLTSADGHVTFRMTQTNGVIASVQILTSDIASASQVSTNTADIAALQAAYAGLTQSDVIIVNGALPSSGQQQNKIYRQPDPDHTPPQFYSDYMWNGSTWVLMATYNNAIDALPTYNSRNLVESGGVYDQCSKLMTVIESYGWASGVATNWFKENIDQIYIVDNNISENKTYKITYIAINNPNIGGNDYLGFQIMDITNSKYGHYKIEATSLVGNTLYKLNRQEGTLSGIDIYIRTNSNYSFISSSESANGHLYEFTPIGLGEELLPFLDQVKASISSINGNITTINENIDTITDNISSLKADSGKYEQITTNDNYVNLAKLYTGYEGKYINENGGLSDNSNFEASDFVEVKSDDLYIISFSHPTAFYAAFYNQNKEFIADSWIRRDFLITGLTFESPVNAVYFRYSCYREIFNNTVLKISDSKSYLNPDIQVKNNQIEQYKIITVKPSGGGDFASLSDAFASITDSSINKKYIVEFYGDGNEYDTLLDKPFVSGEIGLTIPPFTKLLGVGGKEKCILTRSLESVNQNDSVLNLYATSEIEGFTIIGENTRYVIHDDFYRSDELNLVDYERKIKDCVFVGKNTYYHRCYGAGVRSGVKWLFENCIFKNYDSESGNDSFSCHNNTGFTRPTEQKFVNCRFLAHSVYYGVWFGSLNTNANGINNNVIFIGCDIPSIWLYEESAQQYGSGILFKISGFANTIKTDSENIVISNTDGVDYSGNIDLI